MLKKKISFRIGIQYFYNIPINKMIAVEPAQKVTSI